MSDLRPSKALILQASWLYSQMRFSPPASRTNSTIRSKSLRLARRAGEKTTTSSPKASERHAQKMAMLPSTTAPGGLQKPLLHVRMADFSMVAVALLASGPRGGGGTLGLWYFLKKFKEVFELF